MANGIDRRRGVVGESWIAWPVYWNAVWVGVLTALALTVIFGLIGVAIGAHRLGTAGQITAWKDVARGSVIVTVFAAFLAFAAGGWVTVKVAGIRHAEPALLHGVITWLATLPLLLGLLGFGAGNALGGWYGGLVGAPVWAVQAASADPNAAIIARNSALAAVTALLLGLMGSVVGGWAASGEPMSLAYDRGRAGVAAPRA
jgi:hypothetical protein